MFRCVAPSRTQRFLSWGYRTLWSVVCDDLAPHWLWRSLHDLTEFPPLILEVFDSPPSPQAIRSRFIPL